MGVDEILGRTATTAHNAVMNPGGRLCAATTTLNGHLGGCPLPSGLREPARYLGVERQLGIEQRSKRAVHAYTAGAGGLINTQQTFTHWAFQLALATTKL